MTNEHWFSSGFIRSIFASATECSHTHANLIIKQGNQRFFFHVKREKEGKKGRNRNHTNFGFWHCDHISHTQSLSLSCVRSGLIHTDELLVTQIFTSTLMMLASLSLSLTLSKTRFKFNNNIESIILYRQQSPHMRQNVSNCTKFGTRTACKHMWTYTCSIEHGWQSQSEKEIITRFA